MKSILFFMIAIICNSTCYAQESSLSKMTEKARNDYLLKLSKEVVHNFGPEWYKEPFVTEFSGIQVYENKAYDLPEGKKCNGRHYYTIVFRYKKYQNLPKWHFAFKVSVWEDDGEPKDIMFGNDEGITFVFCSYRELLRKGVKKEDQMPYDKYYDEEIKKYYDKSEW